jgi:hypothetical protein
MSDNDEEWFTICDEKNIVLKKNDKNMYKISFTIHYSKNSEDKVLHILKNGQLFELLSALNPDVIDKIDVSEDDNDFHNVFMTFKNGDNQNDLDKLVHVFFSIKYYFSQNTCIIKNQKNVNFLDSQLTKNEVQFIPVSKIKLIATEKNNSSSVSLVFKVEKKISNIVNMYIGLYFKKMFYRFKQYFE